MTLISKTSLRTLLLGATFIFGTTLAFHDTADARVGGGRSSGMSRGSSSYRSAPRQPQSSPSGSPYNNGYAPQQGYKGQPYGQPPAAPRGSFWRGVAGGLAGGLLGSMIFGSLAHGGGGGFAGGSGIGLFEILLLGGAAYFGYRWWRRRQLAEVYAGSAAAFPSKGYGSPGNHYPEPNASTYGSGRSSSASPTGSNDLSSGYSPSYQEIPQGYAPPQPAPTIPSFLESDARTIFTRIQEAWGRQDLAQPLLTAEMASIVLADLQDLQRRGHVSTLERLSIIQATVVEQGSDGGAPTVSVRFVAEAIDVTKDLRTGAIIDGNPHIPQRFTEIWNFRFEHGAWKLAGIEQDTH